MNLIAFNSEITHRLRLRANLRLGLLPYVLMFASFVPLFLLGMWLEARYGIEGVAPKDHPQAGLFITLFLGAMIILMLGGYLLGWLLNAVLLHYCYGWSSAGVRRLLLESEVPVEWLKPGRETANATADESTWAGQRVQGMYSYVLRRGGSWGLFMFLVMGLPRVVFSEGDDRWQQLLIQALLWVIGGLLFGFASWYFSERSYQKQRVRERGQGGAT